jgi:hypothetical protein
MDYTKQCKALESEAIMLNATMRQMYYEENGKLYPRPELGTVPGSLSWKMVQLGMMPKPKAPKAPKEIVKKTIIKPKIYEDPTKLF